MDLPDVSGDTSHPTGCSKSSRLFRGVFTARLTRYASIAGGSLASNMAMASSGLAAIHSSIWPACSHTGMRSWMSADTPLLSPVMMVKAPRLPSGSSGPVSFSQAGGQPRPGGVDELGILLLVDRVHRPLVVTDHWDYAAALLEGQP